MKILISVSRRTKRFISGEQSNRYLREGLMYALLISPFTRKELQLTFYAKETTSPLHGRLCRDGEHIVEFHPQYFSKQSRDGYEHS